MAKVKDISGQRFGRLIVIERSQQRQNRPATWICRCDCGNIKDIFGSNLRLGITKSCGCLAREKATKHGLVYSSEFYAWKGMIKRCYLKSDKHYKDYGQRGIVVCEFIKASPLNLVLTVGFKGDTSLTIDRIDNDSNYSCGQCSECVSKGWTMNIRWASQKQQARNRRNTQRITFNGVTKCGIEWMESLGISREVLNQRIRKGEFILDS